MVQVLHVRHRDPYEIEKRKLADKLKWMGEWLIYEVEQPTDVQTWVDAGEVSRSTRTVVLSHIPACFRARRRAELVG